MADKKTDKIIEEDKRSEPFRVNMTMSKEIVDFYQKMSDDYGIPRSTCMVIGLKTYMDQQNMLELTKKLPTN